jgi:hypothetical protein
VRSSIRTCPALLPLLLDLICWAHANITTASSSPSPLSPSISPRKRLSSAELTETATATATARRKRMASLRLLIEAGVRRGGRQAQQVQTLMFRLFLSCRHRYWILRRCLKGHNGIEGGVWGLSWGWKAFKNGSIEGSTFVRVLLHRLWDGGLYHTRFITLRYANVQISCCSCRTPC